MGVMGAGDENMIDTDRIAKKTISLFSTIFRSAVS